MKLLEIFVESSEDEVLLEGIRFGNREIRMVKKIANTLFLGLEYEYDVNDDAAYDDGGFQSSSDVNEAEQEAVYDRAHSLMNDDMEGKEEEFLESFADTDMNDYNVENGTANLNSIKKSYSDLSEVFETIMRLESEFEVIMTNYDGGTGEISDEEQGVLSVYIGAMKKINRQLNFMDSEMSSLEEEEQLERWVHIIGDSDLASNLEDAKTEINALVILSDNLNELSSKDHSAIESVFTEDYVEFGGSTLEDWLGDIDRLDGDDDQWDREIREEFKTYAVELWDDSKEDYLGYNPEEIYETSFWEEAQNEIDMEGDYNSSDKVSWIDEQLQDSGNQWNIDYGSIREVKLDPSVPNGVETVTKPIKLHAALELMEKMFDHIQDVGSTADNTGLHINVSIRGKNFKRDKFNTAKLIMLLDPVLLKEFFGLRGYISDQFDGVNPEVIYNIADFKASNSGEFVGKANIKAIEFFEDNAFRLVKHQQVNFNNFKDIDDADIHDDRIEFRYVGGKDYEFRYNTIEWNIYRNIYMMLAAFDKDFGQKEYYTAVSKFINEKSEKYFDMPFSDLVKWRKNNEDKSYTEFKAFQRVDGSSKPRDLQQRINTRGNQ